jgi:hypothetical protein
VHVAQALPESPEASESPVLTGAIEMPEIGQSGRKADHFTQSVDDRDLPEMEPGDDHMKAIRTKINRRDDCRRIRLLSLSE